MTGRNISPESNTTLAATHGHSLVSDLAGALRLLRNLSGFGAAPWLDRLAAPRAVSERVELHLGAGQRMAVHVAGQGRPLLLVHGLGGSHRDWDQAVQVLARTHRVYTLDLLGHGSRAAVDACPTLGQMAQDLAAVIDHLDLDRPVLAGHSMGALVIMKYVQDHGAGRLSGLCLIDQSPRITTDEQWRLGLFGSVTRAQLTLALGRLRSDFVETVVSELGANLSLLRRGLDPHCLLGRLLRRVLASVRDAVGLGPVLAMLESVAEADFRDVVARLPVPTMVVLGGVSHHYRGVPLADYYRETLPDGTVRLYKASAHSPHRQEPGRFAADLCAFTAKRCA